LNEAWKPISITGLQLAEKISNAFKEPKYTPVQELPSMWIVPDKAPQIHESDSGFTERPGRIPSLAANAIPSFFAFETAQLASEDRPKVHSVTFQPP